MKHLVLAALALLALNGCAINVNLSTLRFETPEAQGQLGKGEAGAGVALGTKLELIDDDTFSSLSQEANFVGDFVAPFRGEVGLLDRLDISLTGAASTAASPVNLRLKYQILGEPRITSDPGNFSMAVTLAGGAGYKSDYDTDTGNPFIDPTNPVVATYSIHAWDVDTSLIFGYRILDWLLVYGGPFYTHTGFSGWVQQSGSGSQQINLAGTVDEEGANVGVSFDWKHFTLRPELALGAAQATNGSGAVIGLGSVFMFHW